MKPRLPKLKTKLVLLVPVLLTLAGANSPGDVRVAEKAERWPTLKPPSLERGSVSMPLAFGGDPRMQILLPWGHTDCVTS